MTCEQGDAAVIPAPDSTFDCVLSNFAIIFAPDPDAALRDVVRVGKADCRVAFTAWLPGGALGALSHAAEALVRSAVGAPPPEPGVQWHDESSVHALFARYGMSTEVSAPHDLVVTDTSPEAFLEAERTNHPLAIVGYDVLRSRGMSDEANEQLLTVLKDHNEDEDAFRSTSRYVVVVATRN